MRYIYQLPRLLRWVISTVLFLLLAMTLGRLLFYWQYNPPGKAFPFAAFGMGLRFDARVVFGLGLFMLLLCSLRRLNPLVNYRAARFWQLLLTLLFVILLLFYGADYYHYDYLRQRLNAGILTYAGDAAISMEMMWQSYPVLKIILVLALLAALIFVCNGWLLRQYQAKQHFSRKGILVYVVTIICFGGLCFGKLGQFPLRWSDAFTLNDDFEANLSLNPVQSFFSTLSFRHSKPDLQKVKDNYALMAASLGVAQPDKAALNFSRTSMAANKAATRPNVVLVICESFSAYKSSMWGNPLNTTPFFNALCSKGIFFDRCFTPAYGTARGVWATITGIPDVQHPQTASRNPGAVDQHTIINDFAGYEKFYFLGGDPTWANIQGLLANNIRNLHLYSQPDFKAKKIDVWGISDKNLFLEANGILAAQDKPFFAIVQTADNHRPYTIPAEDKALFESKTLPPDSLRKYGFSSNEEYNGFRYTDFCYQQFMQAAQREKYFSNTIFVFVGDHGIRGDAGNMLPEVYTKDGLTCNHVPLLFYAPGLLQPARHTAICSQLDILPSVAALAGTSFTNTTMGRNLFDTGAAKHPGTAFIIDHDEQTTGIISQNWYFRKYIRSGRVDFVPMLNNLAPAGPVTDSIRQRLEWLNTAFYETARWMLVNNKKKNGSAKP